MLKMPLKPSKNIQVTEQSMQKYENIKMKSVTTAVVLQYNLPCYDCIFGVLYNG